jgi:hypothetical protein
MKAVLLSLFVIFILPSTGMAQPAVTTVPNKEFLFLRSLPDSNAALRRDSSKLTAAYTEWLRRYRSDSTRHIAAIRKAGDSLAARQARTVKLRQQLDAARESQSANAAEIGKIVDDSLAYEASMQTIRDSLGKFKAQNKQLTDPAANGATLRRQLAAVTAATQKQDLTEKSQQQRATMLQQRITVLEDSLTLLDAGTGNAVKAENAKLAKQTLADFKRQVDALTNTTDFQTQRITDLKARGQRLSTFYPTMPEFDACMGRLQKFQVMAADADRAIDLLDKPYEPVSCLEGIKSLSGVETITADQAALFAKYRQALMNYCGLNKECCSAITDASKLVSLHDNDDARVVLSKELAKIDKATYSFLYAEMNRLMENAAKGISLKDSKIKAVECK